MSDLTETASSTTTSSGVGTIANASLYELRDVDREFSRGGVTVRAVRGITLDVKEGEMLSLEGPSGSGKSTLLLLLGALDVPSKGSIRFAGRELENEGDGVLTRIRRDEIGFVFQQFNLIPTLTAEENVAVAMAPHRLPKTEQKERARQLLERVGLGHRLGHLPTRLSGGEQQRVAIARALANAPRVVIADEPTGNLDSESADGVMSLIKELNQAEGVTVIIATHDQDIAASARRRIHLRDGSIAEDRST